MKIFSIIIAIFLVFPTLVFAQMSSDNYSVDSAVVGSFGANGSSDNFSSSDTGGEIGTGNMESSNFMTSSGFWQNDGSYSISLSCTHSLALATISDSGKSDLSNNDAACNIKTDNPGGYALYWKASPPEMRNGADSISGYSPATSNVPENWSISNNDSEWGAHLGVTSTTTDILKWGSDDTYADGKWLNVSSSDAEIISRNSATSVGGDDEIIWFGAEIGTEKIQPTGSYSTTITITATTL